LHRTRSLIGGGLSRNPSRTSVVSDAGDDYFLPKARANPYDTVFRKNVNAKMSETKHATAGLTLADFEEIKWPYDFPNIVIDIIEYLTEFNVESIIRQRKQKQIDEQWKKKFTDEARLEREKNPESRVTEKDLIERYHKENKTKEDTDLEDNIALIGEKNFKSLWRFFKALSKNAKSEKRKTKVYLTNESIRKNLSAYFGHETDFFNERLHLTLTKNSPLKRIYINEFILNFYMPLFGPEADRKTRNKFAMELLDIDSDGVLSPKDLCQLDDMIDA
jgi:hypothetical protein